MQKERFTESNSASIIDWAERHRRQILDCMRPGGYTWKGKSSEARDELEEAIKLSKRENDGAIDLETANKVYKWGFNRDFFWQDEKKVEETTRTAFDFLDHDGCYNAVKTLMPISWKVPHPAGATKILGLSNQTKFCIYDSRVGNALRTLRRSATKIILCPSGGNRVGDYVAEEHACNIWAENYQKLIWTLEIIRDYLKDESQLLPRIADIEMALFMIGK